MKQNDTEMLRMALVGYETELFSIDARISELRRQLNGRIGPTVLPTSAANELAVPVRKKRPLSAAARRKMAIAQRKRWAAVKRAAQHN
jgi:hypothetical protein